MGPTVTKPKYTAWNTQTLKDKLYGYKVDISGFEMNYYVFNTDMYINFNKSHNIIFYFDKLRFYHKILRKTSTLMFETLEILEKKIIKTETRYFKISNELSSVQNEIILKFK